jgi:Kef-type K+ transport system membrane component KefB
MIGQRLAEFTRLSPLLYYLIFGCVMGNAHLVDVKESHFLVSFAEVCITFVFFALGFEENVANFVMGIRLAWGIALIGAGVPFLCGFFCTLWFWPGTSMEAALMGGLAVTATAVSLTMVALKAEGLATSKPAIGIMTSAVLDDIGSLALVAICVPIATGEADPTVSGVLQIAGKAVVFFLIVGLCHNVIFPHGVENGPVSYIPGVRCYGLKHVLEFNNGEQAPLVSMTVSFAFAMMAVGLGFHPAIGAYMGGLILEEGYFNVGDDAEGKNTYQHTFNQIEAAAYGWLGPVFFLKLGATIIIEGDILAKVIGYTLTFFVILFLGQFFSAALSARFVPGGFNWYESWMIGFGMLGRAELFFVVLDVCYNEHKIFSKEMFFTFTFTALLLNLAVPICIALYTPKYLQSKKESMAMAKQLTTESGTGSRAVAWSEDVTATGSDGSDFRNSQVGACIEPLSPSLHDSEVGRMALRKAQCKERAQRRRLYRESTIPMSEFAVRNRPAPINFDPDGFSHTMVHTMTTVERPRSPFESEAEHTDTMGHARTDCTNGSRTHAAWSQPGEPNVFVVRPAGKRDDRGWSKTSAGSVESINLDNSQKTVRQSSHSEKSDGSQTLHGSPNGSKSKNGSKEGRAAMRPAPVMEAAYVYTAGPNGTSKANLVVLSPDDLL